MDAASAQDADFISLDQLVTSCNGANRILAIMRVDRRTSMTRLIDMTRRGY